MKESEKIESLFAQAALMISNIEEIGFDMSEYRERLTSLQNKRISSGVAPRVNVDSDVKRLIEQLSNFDDYYKALNYYEWINAKLESNNISQRDLDAFITEMIYTLKTISKSSNDSEIVKDIVNKVYEMAYEIVKLELMLKGSSELYTYIVKDKTHIPALSNLVKNEIGNLNIDSNTSLALRERYYYIRKSGITANYFDLDLIKRLLVYNGNQVIKNEASKRINDSYKSAEESEKQISTLLNDSEKQLKKSQESIERIKRNRVALFARTISLTLALSILGFGGNAIIKAEKNSSYNSKYNKTTSIYSTINKETTTSEEEVFISDPTREVYFRVYDPYKNANRRKYVSYDASFLELETPEDYYNYGVDNIGVVGEKETQSGSNDYPISTYQDSYTEVEMVTYKYLGEDFDKGSFTGKVVLTLLGFVMILVVSEGFYNYYNDGFIISGLISAIIEEAKELSSNKKFKKDSSKKLKEMIDSILKEINKNEEAKQRFEELLDANKYLLDNPEELFNKVKELENSETIKSAKSFVKKINK